MTISLWDFQSEAVRRAIGRGGVYNLFFEMGLGKTRTSIAISQRLHAKRLLVVAPISAVGVWMREIAAVWPEAQAIPIATGLISGRAETVTDLIPVDDSREPTFLLVNYEAYWREPLRTALRAWQPQMIIYDEVHRLKGRSTKQSRFAHALADVIPMRLGLTGTPITHGPEDLYSIFRAIDPKVFGRRWADFEFEYVIRGGYMMRQIIGYRNRPKLERLLQATSARVTKAEALSLPDEVDVTVPVTLSRKCQEVYFKLKKRAIAEVEGHGPDGQPLTGTALARIVLTNILRMQQVTSGFVKVASADPVADPSGGEIIDLGEDKLRILKDMLDDVDGRAVIFARFTRDIQRCAEMVGSLKSPTEPKRQRKVYVLDGHVPFPEREARIKAWNADPDGVIVGQIGATALAVDFTAASVAFYYSLDFDLTHWIQSRARLHRHGQKNKVTYYTLVATGTVDQKILTALLNRESLAKSILDDPRAVFDPAATTPDDANAQQQMQQAALSIDDDGLEEDEEYLASL